MIEFRPHEDWYEDDIEDAENLWRLDLENDIQVQLFAVPDDEDDPRYYHSPRLFIEVDVRDAERWDKRTHYAGKHWNLTEGDAALILACGRQSAAELLVDKIELVAGMPCDQSMLGTMEERWLKWRNRYLAKREEGGVA